MKTKLKSGCRLCQIAHSGARLFKSKGKLLLLIGGIAIYGCDNEVVSPQVVTQVAMVAGEEVIVTRVVRRTVAVEIAVTPVVEETTTPVVLDISFNGGYESLDPHQIVNDNALDIIENVFAGLTRYDLESDTIVPELAAAWTASDDGLTWTFDLRDDIYWVQVRDTGIGMLGGDDGAFQPVRPLVADDVVFAIQRACDPRIPTPDAFIFFIIEGCEQLNGQVDVQQEDLDAVDVRAIDERTVEIKLTEPAADFLTLTAMWQLRPLPVEQVLELGEEWHMADDIMLSGPFVISPSSVADTRTVLVRNPYWPIPFKGNVDIVNILHLDDENEAYALWQGHDLDLGFVPENEQTSILSRNEQKSVLEPDQAVFYLGYNFESPVFRFPEVRQAFSWAIDRERIVKEVQGGRALPMRHFAPPGVVGAPPMDEVGVGYSPDRARQKMDASVFGDCRLMPPIRYLISTSDLALQQAELIREMWIEELGCAEDQIVIEQVQFGTLLASTRPNSGAQRPDLWELGWASYFPDESNWVGDVLHCIESENRQRRECDQVDTLILRANRTTSQEERKELYRQIERQLFGEEAIEPVSPLYVRAKYVLRHSWLSYTAAAFGGEQYDTYMIDQEVKELEKSP